MTVFTVGRSGSGQRDGIAAVVACRPSDAGAQAADKCLKAREPGYAAHDAGISRTVNCVLDIDVIRLISAQRSYDWAISKRHYQKDSCACWCMVQRGERPRVPMVCATMHLLTYAGHCHQAGPARIGFVCTARRRGCRRRPCAHWPTATSDGSAECSPWTRAVVRVAHGSVRAEQSPRYAISRRGGPPTGS